MKRFAFLLLVIIFILLLFSITVTADTRILNQKISDCENGRELHEIVEQGEKVQAKITVLIEEDQELILYTHLQNPSFYLGEEKLSENSSIKFILEPGTHNLRVIGVVPIGEVVDGQMITLLGSDAISCYLTTAITTPFILKTTAYIYAIILGSIAAIFAALIVFLLTRRRMKQIKTGATKKNKDLRERIRDIVKNYLEVIAPNLNLKQREQAKVLMKELDGLLKWQ